MYPQRTLLLTPFILLLSSCQTAPTTPSTNEANKITSNTSQETQKKAPLASAHSTEIKPAASTPSALPPMAAPANKRNSQSELKQGLIDYANGAYESANQHLQNALTIGLARPSDRINANKHLAFIACANGEQTPCRYHFRKVLLVNPRFELSAAEAGHPLWGPVFKEIKAEMKTSK